jgi:hypothetical protein
LDGIERRRDRRARRARDNAVYVTTSEARFALALVERLPGCRDALHGLARRR